MQTSTSIVMCSRRLSSSRSEPSPIKRRTVLQLDPTCLPILRANRWTFKSLRGGDPDRLQISSSGEVFTTDRQRNLTKCRATSGGASTFLWIPSASESSGIWHQNSRPFKTLGHLRTRRRTSNTCFLTTFHNSKNTWVEHAVETPQTYLSCWLVRT